MHTCDAIRIGVVTTRQGDIEPRSRWSREERRRVRMRVKVDREEPLELGGLRSDACDDQGDRSEECTEEG